MTIEEALTFIEAVGDGDDRWEQPFETACALLEKAVAVVNHADLARLLVFIDEHDCYYSPAICHLKGAALGEAAARLKSLESSR